MTLEEVAVAAGGRLERADPLAIPAAVSTDTRTLVPGSLFVALRGERDGHEFLPEAFRAGAVCAVVADGHGISSAGPLLWVDDPQTALQRVATEARSRLTARVIGITGSSGKTLTKELTAAAIAGERRIVASPGSFNNEIGVPLTLLAAAEDTQVLVAEVGARGLGHIALLMPVLRPDIGVVTNVGVAHIGMFGSREAIAAAKAELVEALPGSGAAILNADDDLVAAMRARTEASVVGFGLSPKASVCAESVVLDGDARASFRVRVRAAAPGMSEGDADVALRIPGEHMIPNALAAIAAAAAVGVAVEQAAAGVAGARGARWRMEVVESPGGWRVVNDAYNANPASVAAALKALVAMSRARRTWAVLGEMAELGDVSAAEHDRIGRLAVRLGIARLVVVGEAARPLFEAARLEGGLRPEECMLVPDASAAADIVLRDIAPGDVVLVKASRAAGLETVAERLVSGK